MTTMRTTCPLLCNTLWRTSKCCFLTHTHHSCALDTHMGCRNPHEHWRRIKTDQHVYIYIRVNQIDIYIQVFVGMVSALYVEALSKNNGLVGQLCLKATVHAGFNWHTYVSCTMDRWTKWAYHWTVYTLFWRNHVRHTQVLFSMRRVQTSCTVQTTAHPSTKQGTRLRWAPSCRDRQQAMQGLPTQTQAR